MGWDNTEGISGLHHLQGYRNNNSRNISIRSSIIPCIRTNSSTLDMGSNIRHCSPFRIRCLCLQLSSLLNSDHLVVYLRLVVDLEKVAVGLRVGVDMPIFIKE